MRVSVTHTTRFDYAADVVEAVMDVRLGPLTDDHQRWQRSTLRVSPSARASVRAYTDGFGNTAHLITLPGPHRYVELVAGGEVQTLLVDPFALPAVAPPPLDPAERAEYLAPSALVPRHAGVAALAEPCRPNAPEETFDCVRRLMALVHEQFSYEREVTTVASTVADVLASRRGVCQDFAHVLIGLCRASGIPARYVSGYVVAGDGDEALRGGGASHAWVEAFTPTHGWRGFDPTNNLVASEYHVKMAIGRDYADVPPTRGTCRGATDERLTVSVSARRLG